MKKTILAIATALLVAGSAFTLCACSGGNDKPETPPDSTQTTPETPNTPNNPSTPNTPATPALKKFTGLTLADGSAVYDGLTHPLAVAGTLPDGAGVTYSTNNNSVDAGTYTVTATLKGDGYENLVLTATLTISKADFAGLKFEGATFSYDGAPHSIELVGLVPENSTVTYSCKEDTTLNNSATETGEYTITVTVANKNYNTFTEQAKLKITAEDKHRFITRHGNTLYFANALDGDKLYKYDTTDGLTKVSPDIPYSFAEMDGNLYFRSYTPLASSIKTVGTNGVNTVISAKGEYLCSDGATLYYAVNALTAKNSGIFKVDLSGDKPTAQLISAGKAKYLTCAGNYIYFADGANGDKLTRIAKTGGQRTLVVDEKITCLTYSDGALYYTVNNLLGDYIEKYIISGGTRRKLTSDAGANLTVIGNQLYYINVDLLNSFVFGKGIYCVGTNPVVDNSLPGSKVIEGDNLSYSSLTATDDGKLAYYRVSDQMLCVSDTDGSNTVEILDGFVAPEYTPISTGSKTAAYGKYLYFLDLYNDKALYAYNTVSKSLSRVTSNKVSDFAILGDTLYYNAVSYGVNNDLYKVSLKLGGEPELVSENDCEDIVTDGTNLYYVLSNAAGVRTAIHKIDAQGKDSEMYTKGATDLTYYDGYIYFVDGNKLYKMPTTGYTVDGTTQVTTKNVNTFVINNGVVYFRELYNLNANKRLARVNIDGSNYTAIMTANTDPLKIVVEGDRVYYYTDTVLGTSGIYSISKNATDDNEQPTLILARNGSGKNYYAEDFTLFNGKIYFVNYYNNLGDSHLYSVNISDGQLEKIA
ncbi:MAG: DUF5050 domain-containing protein [Clostridia bacterium]|nr:DUF5050 domain-containing protein [Clostridia bacterium]